MKAVFQHDVDFHLRKATTCNKALAISAHPPADATPTRRRCDADATRIGQWALVDDADATTTRRKVEKMQFLNILANSDGVGFMHPPNDENSGQIADDNRQSRPSWR